MTAHSRRRTIFLIIVLMLVTAAITGLVIRRATMPIIHEVQMEIDDSDKPSGGTARSSERRPFYPQNR